jgi:hypothetical protein
LNDVYEEILERIKSPFFGYLAFSFLAINWKILFFLAFADMSPQMKFYWVDQNSDHYSLFLWPLLTAIVFAIAYPGLQLLISRCVQWFRHKQIELDVEADEKIKSYKEELEKIALKAAKEDELLAEVQREAIARSLPADLKASFNQKVEASRKEFNEPNWPEDSEVYTSPELLSSFHGINQLLKSAGKKPAQVFEVLVHSQSPFQFDFYIAPAIQEERFAGLSNFELERALSVLRSKGLLVKEEISYRVPSGIKRIYLNHLDR